MIRSRIVIEELVDLRRVDILLPSLNHAEDVPLENGDLIPIVENLRIVLLNLAIKCFDLGLVSFLFSLNIGCLAEPGGGRHTATLSTLGPRR